MSTSRAQMSAVVSSAVLALAVFAAPAGAALLPGGGSSGGNSGQGNNSGQGSDPLGLEEALEPLTPGNGSLGDVLDNGLKKVSDIPAPKADVTPAPGNTGSTHSAPQSPSQQSKHPTKRVSRPTSKTASDRPAATHRSSDGPAGPLGAKGVAEHSKSIDSNVAHQSRPAAAPAVGPPPPPKTFVNSFVDRIPVEYRWPVFVLACLALLFAFTSLRERRRSLRVERAALVDSLTGLPNRLAFERRLAKEWRRSDRYDRPLGLLLIDLDNFKHVNDTQGHAAGDAVLREVAAAISGRIRVSDMPARLGGDEFVVICPETPLEGLKVVARSLEERLQEASIASSVGFTEREPSDENPDAFVERADAAMYRRKQSTRKHKKHRPGRLATPQPLLGAVAD
jgi:diguanylate cyclase (GGDEF)-like protein